MDILSIHNIDKKVVHKVHIKHFHMQYKQPLTIIPVYIGPFYYNTIKYFSGIINNPPLYRGVIYSA